MHFGPIPKHYIVFLSTTWKLLPPEVYQPCSMQIRHVIGQNVGVLGSGVVMYNVLACLFHSFLYSHIPRSHILKHVSSCIYDWQAGLNTKDGHLSLVHRPVVGKSEDVGSESRCFVRVGHSYSTMHAPLACQNSHSNLWCNVHLLFLKYT